MIDSQRIYVRAGRSDACMNWGSHTHVSGGLEGSSVEHGGPWAGGGDMPSVQAII